MIDLLFTFSTATVEPPISNQIRFDNLDPALVTRLWIRNETTDGIDASRILTNMRAGARLYVQDKNDHTLASAFTLTATPVDKTTYVECPVAFTSTAGALLNNQAILFLSLEPAGVGPAPLPPPGPPPALITVAEAKLQLKRPDLADDDPDLLQLIESAEASILNWLNREPNGRTNTALWTDPTTTPADVRHAVRLRVAELDRFRGDDLAGETPALDLDSGLSPAITSLLRRYADQVLA